MQSVQGLRTSLNKIGWSKADVSYSYIETPLLLETLSDDSRRALLNKIPADRLGRAEEIGNSIVFLMSYLSSYMYGHGLVVDG